MIGEADLYESDYADLPWDEACRQIASTVYETLSRHGNAARLLVEVLPTGPHGMAVRELLLGTLLRAGFSPETTARAMATLVRYVLGFAMQTPHSAPGDPSPDAGSLETTDLEGFPTVSSVAHLLPRTLPDEFTFGLDLMLAGLQAHLPDSNPARPSGRSGHTPS